jgi:hypothetical protein
MPISINGSGTISGISVGGLENGCVNEADLATAAVTNAKLASNAVTIDKMGSAEQSGLCKAWVNFNGTGTVAIRASYNVSSITDNGVGDYTVNFTTALADANYAVCGACNLNITGNTSRVFSAPAAAAPTTTAVRVATTFSSSTSSEDQQYVHVAVFR